MKKQLIKGILAATLAFVTVLGAPVSVAQSVKSDNTIIAYAKCNHNCRHYGSWTGWTQTNSYYNKGFNEVRSGYAYYVVYHCRGKVRYYCSTCVNCGYKDTAHPLKTEKGDIKLYKVSEKLLGRA